MDFYIYTKKKLEHFKLSMRKNRDRPHAQAKLGPALSLKLRNAMPAGGKIYHRCMRPVTQRQIEHMGLTIEDLTNIRQVSGRDEMI